MSLPSSVGIAMLALFLAGNGIVLARQLFWRRWPVLFWLTSTLILVAVGYLVVMGPAENIVRSIWPIPFDPSKRKEFELRALCETPRMLGSALIFGPMLLVLAPLLLIKIWRSWPNTFKPVWPWIVLSLCVSLLYFLLYASPLPEKLARLAYPEDMLKVPSHCRSSP